MFPLEVRAEVSKQVWASISYGKKLSHEFYTQLTVEGKTQTDGGPTWRSLSGTAHVDYYPNRWLDLIGELHIADTLQFDGTNTFELTPRVGAKFHFLKQALGNYASKDYKSIGPLDELGHRSLERASLGRWDFAILLRIEARNIWYSPGDQFDYSTRARMRLEYKWAINRKSLTDDHTAYLLADIEYFEPFGDDVVERYPSKTRVRAGLGYRVATNHKLEAIYVRDLTRDTPGGQDTLGSQALSLNWKMKF